jgi:hypothetical protein
MSQTLQNQILLAKSMNGIVSLSDGAGTTITNGSIITNDLSGNSVSANTFNIADLNLTGSLEVPAVNDITNPVSGNPTISLLNRGRTQLIDDVYTVGYFNPNNSASTTNLRIGTIALKNQISTAINNLCIGNNAMQGADTPATGFSWNIY